MSRYVLGVDAGQTGTLAVLADTGGVIHGVGAGGAVRHHEERGAQEAVDLAFDAALPAGSFGAVPIDVAVLSVTGSASLVREAVLRRTKVGRVDALPSDALAALASGVATGGGVAIIAGTGSVAVSRSRHHDDHYTVGGWGWLMGDQGGGYWIGVRALRAAARAQDGTGEPTALLDLVCEAFGVTRLRDVYNVVTGRGWDRATIGALGRVVSAAANAGDPASLRILDDGARYLARLARSAAKQGPELGDDERDVVPAGGVLAAEEMRTRFERELGEVLPGFAVRPPAGPPVLGATLLAIGRAGGRADMDALRHLASQQGGWPLLSDKTLLLDTKDPL